jgi:hypothetical protein
MYFFAIFLFILFMLAFLGYAKKVLLRPDKADSPPPKDAP